MNGLVLSSLRYRLRGSTACFVTVFLGATIVGSFASLLATSSGAGVSAADSQTLVTMSGVVGGWGLAIVLFAVASTLTLTVQQRGTELALLRSIGTTPAQVRRLVVGETFVVATVAAVLATVPAWLIGRWVVSLLIDASMVAPGLQHRIGIATVAGTAALMVLASVLAAAIAARRGTRVSTSTALVESSTGADRVGRVRLVLALLLLAGGVSNGFLTVYVMADSADPYAAMSTAGPACVLTSIGLALLAPVLVRTAARLTGGPLRASGVGGWLTSVQAQARSRHLAGVLTPLILFTGMATGTLYLLRIDDAARTASRAVSLAEARTIEALNLVVVGMISVFAAIMVINTLVAATLHRRREFGQQRLAGATPSQVFSMVGTEGLLLVLSGIVVGSLASLATIVPYSILRLDRVLPDTGIATYLGVVSVAVLVTLGSGLGATRTALRTPAVEAARA